MSRSSLRIVVAGLVGRFPVGGVAWDYLQYVVGLARLGHEVVYHEDTWSWPYHPVQRTYLGDGAYSARFIDGFFRRYAPELRGGWHYRHLHEQSYGLSQAAFDDFARGADVFLNVSGASVIPESLGPDCVTVFLDTDPGYNQIMLSERHAWSENVERWCTGVAAHDRHFTYAENLGRPDCLVPSAGFSWAPTRMPIVLDLWSELAEQGRSARAPWTTVTTWNAFGGELSYQGVTYGSKDAEFAKIADLPAKGGVRLKVALGGVEPPVERLRAGGWEVVDGPTATLTPARYRGFIASSRGELSTAKHVYVAMRTGWFSCRSACYLAAGRPVVVQDTGFGHLFPTREGIVAFSTVDEAAAGLGDAQARYALHAAAAREIAHEYFDSRRVLTSLVREATAA